MVDGPGMFFSNNIKTNLRSEIKTCLSLYTCPETPMALLSSIIPTHWPGLHSSLHKPALDKFMPGSALLRLLMEEGSDITTYGYLI